MGERTVGGGPAEYEPFGNFNYGAAGRNIAGFGIPAGNLFQEAGRAQARDGNINPKFGHPGVRFLPFTGSGAFGDDPVDQFWSEQGVRYGDAR